MKAAIIGASEESLHAIEQAAKLRIETVALDKNPDAPGLSHATIGLNVDISDEKAVIEALEQEKPDFCLPVPIGRYLTTIGAVNDAFHLPGLTSKVAQICTDKYQFHQVLRNRSLRMGHCYLVNRKNLVLPFEIDFPAVLKPRYGSGSRGIYYLKDRAELEQTMIELFDLPEDFYKPVLQKRTEGSAAAAMPQSDRLTRELNRVASMRAESTGMSRPKGNDATGEKKEHLSASDFLRKRNGHEVAKENANAFQAQLKQTMEERDQKSKSSARGADADEDFVLEAAFPGEEYGVDAVVEGCNFEMILLRRKINTPLPERQAVGYLSVVPDYEPRLAGIVREYMSNVVQAMGMKDCILHADLMVFGRNVNAIEVSARPSGHNLHNLFTPMATGIDICGQYLNYLSGEPHNFQPLQTRKMMIHYFDMENCFVHGIPDPDQLELPERVKLKDWKCNLKLLDYMGKVTTGHSIMGRGYYILEGPDDKTLLAAADMIKSQFELM